ncbi:unnamed protein product, partial [Meganyctiphanes norvegica]
RNMECQESCADMRNSQEDNNSHNKGHHVQFSPDTDKLGNTAIVIVEKSPENLEAHLGFLQLYHRYLITIQLPVKEDDEAYQITDTPTVYCRIISLQITDPGQLEVQFELLAHKEKLLKEKLQLLCPSGNILTVTVMARVLGKNKGTPMLRDGIHILSIEPEEESEVSDWTGFD